MATSNCKGREKKRREGGKGFEEGIVELVQGLVLLCQ